MVPGFIPILPPIGDDDVGEPDAEPVAVTVADGDSLVG